MPRRTSLPVNFSETSPFELSQETRREGLVNVPNLSLESFLPLPRLPWHNTQGWPRYCLSWGKNEKGGKLSCLSSSTECVFFQAEEGKKKRQHHNTPLPHLAIHLTVLCLYLAEFMRCLICFMLSFSLPTSLSHPLFDAIFLSASFRSFSFFSLSAPWHLRCFPFFALYSARPLCPLVWELSFGLFLLDHKSRGLNTFLITGSGPERPGHFHKKEGGCLPSSRAFSM